jgi:NADH-quinone oxidoreductase subunit L
VHLFSGFIQNALPATVMAISREAYESLFEWISGGTALLGVAIIYALILRMPEFIAKLTGSPTGKILHRYWFRGSEFDALYDRILVQPYVFLARLDREDIIDSFFDLISWLGGLAHRVLSMTQNGRMRTYAAGLAIGAAVVVGMVVLL